MRFAVQSELIDYNPAQEIAGAVATAKRQHRAALELNRIPELLHRIDHYSGRPLPDWLLNSICWFLSVQASYVLPAGQKWILKRLCELSRVSVNHLKALSILSVVQRCGRLILYPYPDKLSPFWKRSKA